MSYLNCCSDGIYKVDVCLNRYSEIMYLVFNARKLTLKRRYNSSNYKLEAEIVKDNDSELVFKITYTGLLSDMGYETMPETKTEFHLTLNKKLFILTSQDPDVKQIYVYPINEEWAIMLAFRAIPPFIFTMDKEYNLYLRGCVESIGIMSQTIEDTPFQRQYKVILTGDLFLYNDIKIGRFEFDMILYKKTKTIKAIKGKEVLYDSLLNIGTKNVTSNSDDFMDITEGYICGDKERE